MERDRRADAHDARMTQAWVTASLQRCEANKFPKLETLMANHRPQARQSKTEQRVMVEALAARLGKRLRIAKKPKGTR